MTDKLVDVSVIIPAYRAAQTIGRTLHSIARQTVTPREIVIVDDGSDDDTAKVARSFADMLAPCALKIVTQPNLGAGAARNRALVEATQPLVAFLDADDEWLPEKLERSVAEMNADDYVLVAHDYLNVTPSGDEVCDCRQRFLAPPDPWIQLYRRGYIPSCSVVAKRDAVLAVGGFDESLRNAQDFDLWLRLLDPPDAKFTVFSGALLRYHHTPGGIMSFTERRLACCEIIAVRHLSGIRARGGSTLFELGFRMAAIHLEAIHAYRHDERPLSALKTFILLAFRFCRACVDGMMGNDTPPVSSITSASNQAMPASASNAAPKTTQGSNSIWAVAGISWAAAILVAYLVQFQSLVGPVLRKLGLSG
mgnify:CR=1 FL=1